MNKIVLIDGFGFIFKAYYAFINRPLKNAKGENTSCIFGFFRSLISILKQESPDYYVVALEGQGECFRNTIYPEYKKNRPPAPEDLVAQIPKLLELIKLMDVPHIAVDTFEADDVIGTLSEKLGKSGEHKVIIYSSDKDLRQLANQNVVVNHPQRSSDEFAEYNEAVILEKMGVKPSQVIDYLALVGDSSDNIPGVKGIGPKSAVKILSKFETLENIYNNIENPELKKAKNKLVTDKDNAFLSQKLATIDLDVPLKIELEKWKSKSLNLAQSIDLLKQDNLNSLIDNINKFNKDQFSDIFHMDSAAADTAEINTSFKTISKDFEIITDLEKIKEKISDIEKNGAFCFDLETTGFDYFNDKIICISFSTGDDSYIVPLHLSMFQQNEANVSIDSNYINQLKELLKPLFTNEKLVKIGHNLKFDIKFLRNIGVETTAPLFDTMLAEYCIDASHNILSMDDLAEKYLSYKTIHYSDVVGNPKKETLQDVPLKDLIQYASEDSDITYQLYEVLSKKIDEKDKTKKLFYEIEMPLLEVLIDMEYYGVKIDLPYLKTLSTDFENKINSITDKIYSQTNENFNINSTKQVGDILFNKLQLPVVKKTKTGPSTDVEVLTKLAQIHPVPGLLLEYRTISKLKSTYSDALPELINNKTDKIHTTYMQTGTQTGRLSSKTPNLQNIPVKTEIGNKIRQAFIPTQNNLLISADYSQIELYLLACFSKDPNLFEAFQTGQDIHTKTASLIFGKELDDVSKEERSFGKTINFSILYGQGPHRLSENLNTTREEASNFLKLYFKSYAGIKEYMDTVKEDCRKNGYAETHWGRRRTIPEINDKNKMRQANGERMSVNTTIQGTAADLIKLSMIKIHREFSDKQLKSNLIMQVHDELIFEVDPAEKDQVIDIIKNCMEEGYDFPLQLKTSIRTGNNWGELK